MPRVHRPSPNALLRELTPAESADIRSTIEFGWRLPDRVELVGRGRRRTVRSYFGPVWRQAGAREARDAFGAFLRLPGAMDSKVRDFVERYGALRISAIPDEDGSFTIDGVRMSGGMTIDGVRQVSRWPIVNEPIGETAVLNEEVAWYRLYAGVALATLSAAKHARGDAADFDPATLMPFAIPRAYAPTAGELVGDVVNGWLRHAHVSMHLVWEERRPMIGWTGGLWGALGRSMLVSVLRNTGNAVCANCGTTIRRKASQRRPQAGRLSWCERDECQRARLREAKARSRARSSVSA